jgi:hypothetical protein
MDRMNDETKDEPVLSARLMDAAREYQDPPPPPREEMWLRVQAARSGGRAAGRPVWKSPKVWVPIAIAATLILGIGIGRGWPSIRNVLKQNIAQNPDSTATTPTAAPKKKDLFAQYAAEQTLGQAEVLLTQYRSDVAAGVQPTTTPAEARKILLATRLLLDAPSITDPHLRDLLSDLELVMAQISEGSVQKEDRAVITEGLERRDVLPRLRAATSIGTGVQIPGAI